MKLAIQVVVALALLAGCSEKAAVVANNETNEAFLSTYRDKIIDNWESTVLPKAKCERFKSKFRTTGERFSGNQSESFMTSMMQVGEEVRKAGCGANI